MPTWAALIIGIVGSTGLWSLVQWFAQKKSADNSLLLGLAHDRILALCSEYLQRGSITQAEYENLDKYLYQPYIKRGGNGLVKKMMEQVNKLSITEVQHGL